MILPIALLVLGKQGQTLTLTFPPTPVVKAVELLARASGRRLAVAQALHDEVVLARLKDAPVEATLQHLADSLVAKWTVRNDGKTWLEPDAKQLRLIHSEKRKLEQEAYATAQKILLDDLAKQPAEWDQKRTNAYHEWKEKGKAEWKQRFTDPDSVTMMEGPESPIWRAIVKIDATLDPKELAAMPEGDREVWAEDPTSVQHAFSSEAQAAIQRLRQEIGFVEPNQTCTRVKLQVKKWSPGSVDTMLFAYSSSGKVIEATTSWLDPEMVSRQIKLLNMGATDAEAIVIKPFPNIEILPDVLSIRRALAVTYRGKDQYDLFIKSQSQFEDPVKFEPLQWHHGLDLVLAAEATNQQLIGTINDFTNSRYWDFTPKTGHQILFEEKVNQLKSEPGWVVIRGNTNGERVSRSKAKDLSRHSLRIGGVTVDMAADWELHSTFPRPFLAWVGDYLSDIHSDNGEFSTLAGLVNYHNLDLWAKFGNSTLAALKRGETIEVRHLADPARQQLSKMVYWQFLLDDPKIEPTDAWPNGTVDGELKMEVTDKPVFIGWSSAKGPTVSKRPLDATSFGRLLAEGQVLGRPIPPLTFRQYDRFKIGTCRIYDLLITLQPGSIPMKLRYSETLFPPENQTLNALPSEFAAEVEKARQYALAHPTQKPAPPEIHP